MQAEPAFQWSQPVTEFIGFLSLFLANGAIGFRYAAVRNRLTAAKTDAQRPIYVSATRYAASLGLLGTLIQVVLFVMELPRLAGRMHLSVGQLLTSDPQTIARSILLLLAVLGFALAATTAPRGSHPSGVSSAWLLAAIGLIGAELSGILSGRWAGMINPVHQLLAGLWLGTLSILVIAGFAVVLRDAPRAERGPMIADLVNGFSPLALTCGPLLVATGVTTALMHLHPFSSLWSTAYGYALLVKLCLVAIVFSLGAWNWRRQRPRLGSEQAASLIRRSSVMELSVATLILLVTSILVSLPAPRAPRPVGGTASPPVPAEPAH
jgi:putative copper export protein